MKTIKIRDEIWNMIVQNGKFGETADDVLFRLLNQSGRAATESGVGNAPKNPPTMVEAPQYGWKQRRAAVRMTQNVDHGELVLRFDTGQTEKWKLPAEDDVKEIRRVRSAAIAFVKKNGGTIGQERAAIRALTSRGYHVASRSTEIFV